MVLRKLGAIRSVAAKPFAEAWPERPAAKRQERKKWCSANRERSGLCRQGHCGAVARAARREAARAEKMALRKYGAIRPLSVRPSRSRGPSGPKRHKQDKIALSKDGAILSSGPET